MHHLQFAVALCTSAMVSAIDVKLTDKHPQSCGIRPIVVLTLPQSRQHALHSRSLTHARGICCLLRWFHRQHVLDTTQQPEAAWHALYVLRE